MLSKNNYHEKNKKLNQKQARFSIRKLSVGAASVLIGISLLSFTNGNVKADTTSSQITEETSNNKAVENTSDTTDNTASETKDTTDNTASETKDTTDDTSQKAAMVATPASEVKKATSTSTGEISSTEANDNKTTIDKSDVDSTNNANTESTSNTKSSNENTSKDATTSTDSITTQNKALESLEEAKKAPAVQPSAGQQNSDGEVIKNGINSQTSITGKNKYTGETSSSSANGVQVNSSVAEDLNMVITLQNNSDTDAKIAGTSPNNAYELPAYYGTNDVNIVVDSSRVSTANNQINFGGNYQDSDVKISYWDIANDVGSSGFNDRADTIAKAIADPSIIGGFQITGSMKAHQIVTIIVPLKIVNPDQKSGGSRFGRQWGQQVTVSVDPENGRSASDYTSVNTSVDGLVENNIVNLDVNNGNLDITTDITNGGFLTHQETLDFDLQNLANSSNEHQVYVVLDHSKNITLDWQGANADNIQYKVNGSYKTASQMTDEDWENVTAVRVQADLASGATGKVTIPVKAKNAEQIKTDLNDAVNLSQSNLRRNTVSISASVDNNSIGNQFESTYYYELPATASMNAINKNINHEESIEATVLVIAADGTRHYVPLSDAQSLMPYLDKDDFTYRNVGHTGNSDVLFTDGFYTIKLEKIFNAIKDHGYSVNIQNSDNKEATWPVYSYTAYSNGNFGLYVQLQQIFNTKDLNLTTDDTWNSNDSLVSANVEFYNMTTMQPTGSTDLKTTGNYTYDLYDPEGNQIAKNVAVGENVGKLSAGRYRVVYHYAINDNEMVSREAYINVSEPVQPTEPEQPTTPINPTNPEQPTTPINPTNPEQPTTPVNPTNPEQPTTPVNPTNPEQPTDSNITPHPETPTQPSEPIAPSTPEENISDNTSENTRPLPQDKDDNSNKKDSGNNTTEKTNNSNTVKSTNSVENKSNENTGSELVSVHSQDIKHVSTNEKTLPQTGEKKQSNASIFGLLATIFGFFGLAGAKRKEKDL